MSNSKKKIGLICKSIKFTSFSIVYNVEFDIKETSIHSNTGVVFCSNDIQDKDLILKPTMISPESMEVIFTPSNVTPHFYQSIYNGTIKNINEYEIEKRNIYGVGEIVGYIYGVELP